MKRKLKFVLLSACIMLMSSCGNSEGNTSTTATAGTTELITTEKQTETEVDITEEASSETESTTESDILPEQDVIADKMDYALSVGIINDTMYKRADEIISRKETARVLQNSFQHGYGKQSRYLKDMEWGVYSEVDYNRPATRYFLTQLIFFAECENYFDFDYDNYYVWAENCTYTDRSLSQGPDAALVVKEDMEGKVGESGLWSCCRDLSDIEQGTGAENEEFYVDYGCTPAVDYCLKMYDRYDGKKIVELDDEMKFRPFEELTVRDAVEAAVRYYRSFEAPAEMVSYADTYEYDKTIITDELLSKESSLPDCSCSNLPAEWHGVLISDMAWVTSQACGNTPDKHLYDYEIQAVKDSGFNFIGLMFNFSTLQGPVPEEGKLNETRLKELDRVIADCIERDIHVQLRCVGVGGSTAETPHSEDMERGTLVLSDLSYSTEFAALWKAIAQRYRNIPNKYLDFNLLVEAGVSSEDQYVEWFSPSIDAIREISPDRCIVADIHSGGITGEGMAKLGVALSAHLYEPRELYYDPSLPEEEYINKLVWPYTASDGVTYDAEKAFNKIYNGESTNNDTAEVAKKYGVGFMVGEWGTFGTTRLRKRASNEVIRSNFIDMTDYMKKMGYGWCYADAFYQYGACGIVEWVDDAEYERVEDYYLYRDVYISDLFREINGVK